MQLLTVHKKNLTKLNAIQNNLTYRKSSQFLIQLVVVVPQISLPPDTLSSYIRNETGMKNLIVTYNHRIPKRVKQPFYRYYRFYIEIYHRSRITLKTVYAEPKRKQNK